MTDVSRRPSTLYLRLLDSGLRITAPHPKILRELGQLFESFRRDRLKSVAHHIELRDSHSPGEAPAMHILVNGHTRYRSVPVSELIPYLEWIANNLFVFSREGEERYCLIHAAVVARGTQGILLCGNTGCGKSSLSLALILRQYRYLTDEIACWDVGRKRILAYPRAISLKESGYRKFSEKQIRLPIKAWKTEAFEGKVWYIRPAEISSQIIGKSARVRLVIFPAYRHDQATRLHPISKGRAIMLLHRHRFDGNGFGRKDFEVLTELVRDASAFRLVYGNVMEAAALIDALTRKRGRP